MSNDMGCPMMQKVTQKSTFPTTGHQYVWPAAFSNFFVMKTSGICPSCYYGFALQDPFLTGSYAVAMVRAGQVWVVEHRKLPSSQ